MACINAAAEQDPSREWGEDVVGVIRAQMRLQALDFWMRNPDYLANELLSDYERERDPTLLREARAIFDANEPDLRRFPMVRYLFGAFEPLDDALALLRAHDFVRVHREGVPGEHVREHVYVLTAQGRSAMEKLSSLAPELGWYPERARLVVRVAGGAGGKALKDRQYLQREYAETAQGKVIAPITERVRKRLSAITEGDVS